MKTAKKILSQKLFFKQEMAAQLPPESVERVWADATRRLDRMLAAHPALPKGVRRHTDSLIFPAAALYLALKEENAALAFSIMEAAMKKKALQSGAMLQKLTGLPGGKGLFLRLWDPVSHSMFGPTAGFRNTFYPRRKNEFRMDILACPYQKYLTELGCPELTVLFCKNDEYSYGNLDGLDFIRTQTLGAGGEKCDFLMVRRR